MKQLFVLLVGTFFGLVLAKSEVVSWFRIQKMFRFEEAHMYLIIGSAVVVGAISVYLIKKFQFPPSLGKGGQGGWGKISDHGLMWCYPNL